MEYNCMQGKTVQLIYEFAIFVSLMSGLKTVG